MMSRSYAKQLWFVATVEGFLFGRAAAIEGSRREMIRRVNEEVRLREVNSIMLHDLDQIQQSPVFWKAVDQESIVGRL